MKSWTRSTDFFAACLVIIPTLLGVLSDEFHIFALGTAALLVVMMIIMSAPQLGALWRDGFKKAEH